MKVGIRSPVVVSLGVLAALSAAWLVGALGQGAVVGEVRRLGNGDLELSVSLPAGAYFRVDASDGLGGWEALATMRSGGAGTETLADTGAPYLAERYYRVVELEGSGWLTGDHLATSAGDAVIHPVEHASLLITWNGLAVYSDPVGGAAPYQGLPRGDVIVVTHTHGDHFNAGTLQALLVEGGTIVAPQAVFAGMNASLRAATTVLANGESATAGGVGVEAVPAYNSRHPVGAGNSYVLTLGDKRVFLSGDTGPAAEIRALEGIDVAFLCMNLPFTMGIGEAAATTRDMAPAVIYPYHYRNQNGSFADLEAFREMVGVDLGVEVRVRDWY